MRSGWTKAAAVVLYQGGFSRDRGIETLLEAIHDVPGAVLVLMGYGNLEELLRAEEAAGGRIRVLPPSRRRAALVGRLADVVAMPIQPSTRTTA
jgi:hypothetical protein